MSQQRTKYYDLPSTTRVEIVSGKKYLVVNHYVGRKDFKKIICDHAFKQALADNRKSA